MCFTEDLHSPTVLSMETQALGAQSVAEEQTCGKLVAYERITSRLLIGHSKR